MQMQFYCNKNNLGLVLILNLMSVHSSHHYTVLIKRVWYFVTLTNHGQLSKPGTVLESANPEDFKTVPESWIWSRFAWV